MPTYLRGPVLRALLRRALTCPVAAAAARAVVRGALADAGGVRALAASRLGVGWRSVARYASPTGAAT